MKRLGFYMTAAVLTLGMVGTASISSEAAYQRIKIGGNGLSGGNGFSCGQPMGNSCESWQSILSSISDYCSNIYNSSTGNPNPYTCSNNFSNEVCSAPSGVNGSHCLEDYIFNRNCVDDEEYFPEQRPEGNYKPEQNKPEEDNKPEQNKPVENNKPEQNKPEQNKPEESNKPEQNKPEESNKPEQNKPEESNKPEQNKPVENTPGQNVPGGSNTTSAYVQQVIDLVNEERAKAGLSPLTESSSVSKAAAVRAKEITRNFSHTRPDGTEFSTVLRQNGISFIHSGENIAYGQKTPQEVMNTWMNSSGHRANILNSNYTTIGVGCYQGSNGTLYWTQLFTR